MAVVKVEKGSCSILIMDTEKQARCCLLCWFRVSRSITAQTWSCETHQVSVIVPCCHGERQYLCLPGLHLLLGFGFPTALKTSTYRCQHVCPVCVSSLDSCRPKPLGCCSSCEMLGQGKKELYSLFFFFLIIILMSIVQPFKDYI